MGRVSERENNFGISEGFHLRLRSNVFICRETIKTKYEGKITKELSGPTYEVLAKIMKVLVKTKITTPGSFVGWATISVFVQLYWIVERKSNDFSKCFRHSGTAAISCSFKAAAGYIYPLDRGFIYIHKPPIHIRFEEILCVNFAREGGTNRWVFI